MLEEELAVESNGAVLKGTLCLSESENDCPIVFTVHGSGPLDRNANSKQSRMNIFNAVSDHLVKAGIGCLRYDKRGCGGSSGDYYTAGHLDLVADAGAWITHLEKHPLTAGRKIFVLGHSEGTVIAPQLCRTHDSITGIILLCPFVRDFESILLKQARNMQKEIDEAKGLWGSLVRLLFKFIGNLEERQKKLIIKLKASTAPTLRYWFVKISAKWFKELMALNPKAVFENVACPALLIGGEKDLQCEPGDVHEIRNLVKERTEAYVVDDLTHILRKDENPPAYSRYKTLLKKPMDKEVLDLITDWLRSFPTIA